MEDVVKIISNYGTSIVIVALFIWDWVANRKKITESTEQNTEILSELKKSNENIGKSLDLLKEYLMTHDRETKEELKMTVEELERKIDECVGSVKDALKK